jgi:hypothetical protein
VKGKLIAIILCSIIAVTGCSCSQKPSDNARTVTKSVSKSSNFKVSQELNYKRDLDSDGVEEIINFIFYEKQGSNTHDQYYNISITSGPKQYSYKSDTNYNISTNVNFADLDTNDRFTEFYVNSEGPSDDPGSAIYRLDKGGIRKICDTAGYITEYDRGGKVYTNFSRTQDKYGVDLSYYDIRKGSLVFADKRSLIGKKLQYDNSLILFTDMADKNKLCVSYVNDNQGIEEVNKTLANYNKDSIIKLCKPNEKLTITDIDNTYHGMFKDGNPRNIRIKVKAPDGKEGWLDWLNGGD